MTTKRRAPAAKTGTAAGQRGATKRSTTKRTAKRKAASTRSTRSRNTASTHTTRRRTSTATTLGAGAGTVVMAFVLGAPWSVRIALIVLVLVVGGGYLIWSRRS